LLGGGISDLGGLHVIGTERHESRRIDNQLRGRAGRQGDNGSSQFYLSLEDDLMRIFASDRVIAIMDRLGMEEDVPIQDKLVTKSIASAQKKVELHHFDQREHLLKYDDVLNKQREVIYSMRRMVLDGHATRDLVKDLTREFINDIVTQFCISGVKPENWDWKLLTEAMQSSFNLKLSESEIAALQGSDQTKPTQVSELINKKAWELFEDKERSFGEKTVRDLEKFFLIQAIDNHWKEHLLALDHLKEGIHLRGYAQKDPLVEYRKEGFSLFKMLDRAIRQSALTRLYTVQLVSPEEQERQRREYERQQLAQAQEAQMTAPSLDTQEGGGVESPAQEATQAAPEAKPIDPAAQRGVDAAMNFLKNFQAQRMKELEKAQTTRSADAPAQKEGGNVATVKSDAPKIGRNDPCFCGSGKKFKNCHGTQVQQQ
jgi:preprotein translocase subunit SecA